MQGVIVAYSEQKKYGFITGEDGESYFFHRNHLKQQNHSPQKGFSVSFDPVPTPKGMAARQIDVKDKEPSYWTYHTPDEFITSKSSQCGRHNEVIAEGRRISYAAKSPVEVREGLANKAKAAGFNGLILTHMDRETGWSKLNPNYKYTYHRFSGVPAIIRRREAVADKAAADASKAALDTAVKSALSTTITNQDHDDGKLFAFVMSGFAILVFLFVMLSTMG
ncbi:cold-shock protein [Pseudidiomarina sp.]|jgi:cold shock CspA family protein|uniref:cold-shock protein n=1 Tax=Pseudidiomarina sp. TaxID=2081707 RepID=UPI003A977344